MRDIGPKSTRPCLITKTQNKQRRNALTVQTRRSKHHKQTNPHTHAHAHAHTHTQRRIPTKPCWVSEVSFGLDRLFRLHEKFGNLQWTSLARGFASPLDIRCRRTFIFRPGMSFAILKSGYDHVRSPTLFGCHRPGGPGRARGPQGLPAWPCQCRGQAHSAESECWKPY